MKKILFPSIVIILFAFLVYITINLRTETPLSSGALTTYLNADIGLEFAYTTGPDGYIIQEEIPTIFTDNLVRTIILTRSSDVIKDVPFVGEYPPTLSIRVFKNVSSLAPQVWAQKYIKYSLFNLKKGILSDTVIGGTNGITYQADGLYMSQVSVLEYAGYIYVVRGEYSSDYNDYMSLVQSITFIPFSPIVVKDFEGEADVKKMTLDMKEWSWVKTVYTDGTTVTPKIAKKFTMTLKKDGTFSASTDCNGVGGEYTTNKNTIKFERMMSTLMFCENSQEQEFSRMIADVKGYSFTSKGELVFTLTSPQGSVYFR